MFNNLVALLIAAMCSTGLEAGAHAYGQKILAGKLKRPPWSYVVGTVLLGGPYLALLAYWRDGWAFAAAVAVVVFGGFPVIFGYNIRGQIGTKDYQMLLSEHLADEREISHNLRCELIEAKREIARLVAKLAAVEGGDDG